MSDEETKKLLNTVLEKGNKARDSKVEERLKVILIEFNKTGELNKTNLYDLVKFITLMYPTEHNRPEQKNNNLMSQREQVIEELKKIYKRSQVRKDMH